MRPTDWIDYATLRAATWGKETWTTPKNEEADPIGARENGEKKIICIAAENAIAAGRINKSDVSPRFIPTLSEETLELGSARTGSGAKRQSKKQRIH